ncbi:uncharacterized protein EI90DRAFT_432343 [Cantharellus anzutake]|uniref:uncharacterized protein n=1 Tax=Cantharellus anzutake TaxID=1750568 RepID=UPI001904101A|nr:uncharacterized protein EI90DRAFT_432343 [Cantharellus anzutake]KAF8314581.1 hypothetical protein EI90DRAFT_432343 [Cantharellus anzutake]
MGNSRSHVACACIAKLSHLQKKRFGVQIAFPDSKRPTWDQQPIKNMPSPRPGDGSEVQFTKLRGSQAQLPLMDRMKRFLQVTLRVPAQFHRDLKSTNVIKRLESMGVDAQISNPMDDHFECLLSAVRQEDLEAGQHDISRMASRISKGWPAIDPLPTAKRKTSREGNVIINEPDRVRDLPPPPRGEGPITRERTRSVRVKP